MTTNESTRDALVELHAGLTDRRTPQVVAEDLLRIGADGWVPKREAAVLRALAQDAHWYRGDRAWKKHPGLARAYNAAASAMSVVADTVSLDPLPAADPTDPVSLCTWLDLALTDLGLTGEVHPARRSQQPRTRTLTYYGYTSSVPVHPRGRRGDRSGHVDPRTRHDAARRRAHLPGVSVRTYRRAVAAVTHLQQRTAVLAAERDREACIAFGKSRLAYRIGFDAFSACPRTAAFVAYYVGRLNAQTVFTNGSQDRPMDDVAAALLTAALNSPTVRADVIARVLTRQSVLTLLSEAERGALLGAYWEQLGASARLLDATFDRNRDRAAMVVRRGDDSSTWNAASRAFNQARTGWLNLLRGQGLDFLLEGMCPGKVPALVAGDVAHWHEESGGGAHADAAVFADLPLPWDVVLRGALCPASLVRRVCESHGLDADITGWTSPYRQASLATAAAAAPLVHGIAVASPLLADWLRRQGALSGQAA